MLARFPRTLRVFIGLLLVLTHVALQPGKALSLVICTEQDGRAVIEVAAAGSCLDSVAINKANVAEFAAASCEGCADRLFPPDSAPTMSSKRGEAPQTILPTGPPSQDQQTAPIADYSFTGSLRAFAPYFAFDVDFEDPLLSSLRSVRLLI